MGATKAALVSGRAAREPSPPPPCDLNGRGKISVAGTAPSATGPFVLPIVGRTSEFAGARGQLLVTPIGHGNDMLTFYLLP